MMTKYERHIHQLCHKHKIQIRYAQSDFAASAAGKIIWIKRHIRTIKPYTVALHEIGHVINEKSFAQKHMWKYIWSYETSGPYTSKFIMPLELNAWKTARKLAKWWNSAADRNALRGLFSYWYGYNDFHKQPYLNVSNRLLNRLVKKAKRNEKSLHQISALIFEGA